GTGDGELRTRTEAVRAFCVARGFAVASIEHDVEADQRPSLARALASLADERADALVVARLRDLASHVAARVPLLRWFDSEKRTLIAIDLDIDTSTEAGRKTALALVGVGGWETERAQRGLEAAAEAAARGQGRTAVADHPELHERIARMREDG